MSYWLYHDPQTEKGHFCAECGREHFNDGDLCARCAEDAKEDE